MNKLHSLEDNYKQVSTHFIFKAFLKSVCCPVDKTFASPVCRKCIKERFRFRLTFGMLTLDQKSSKCSLIFSVLYLEYKMANSVNIPIWARSKPGMKKKNKKKIWSNFQMLFLFPSISTIYSHNLHVCDNHHDYGDFRNF